jgi:hypothetical protein
LPSFKTARERAANLGAAALGHDIHDQDHDQPQQARHGHRHGGPCPQEHAHGGSRAPQAPPLRIPIKTASRQGTLRVDRTSQEAGPVTRPHPVTHQRRPDRAVPGKVVLGPAELHLDRGGAARQGQACVAGRRAETNRARTCGQRQDRRYVPLTGNPRRTRGAGFESGRHGGEVSGHRAIR